MSIAEVVDGTVQGHHEGEECPVKAEKEPAGRPTSVTEPCPHVRHAEQGDPHQDIDVNSPAEPGEGRRRHELGHDDQRSKMRNASERVIMATTMITAMSRGAVNSVVRSGLS